MLRMFVRVPAFKHPRALITSMEGARADFKRRDGQLTSTTSTNLTRTCVLGKIILLDLVEVALQRIVEHPAVAGREVLFEDDLHRISNFQLQAILQELVIGISGSEIVRQGCIEFGKTRGLRHSLYQGSDCHC